MRGVVPSSPVCSAAALVAVCWAATAATAPSELLPIDAFSSKPRIREIALSPDGDRVAVLVREEHGSSVWLLDVDSGARSHRLSSKLIESLHWSSDGQALLVETADRIAHLPVSGGRAAWIVRLDPDREQRFVGVDPTHPQHVLVTESPKDTEHRLLRIGAHRSTAVVHHSDQAIRAFLLGPDGAPAFVKRIASSQHAGQQAGKQVVEQVIVGLGDPPVELLRCPATDPCSLLGASRDGRHLVLRAYLDHDRLSLFQLDTISREIRTLHTDPQGIADLARVALDGPRPLLVSYDTDRRRVYALDPKEQAHLDAIRAALGDLSLDIQARTGASHWLIESYSSTRQRRYHLYATGTGQLSPILDDLHGPDPLPSARLVEREFVRTTASDGMTLYGFVSTPKAVDLGTTPVVVRVHGGPWNHVQPELSVYTQFLVDRGYIVFEPNFRSSTGYGRRYVLAGRDQFGNGRVHQDILDGLDHLLAQGIGDPHRVAIVGHSFGGFATLTGLAFTPERFKVGIASAPPIDLVRAARDLDDEETLANGIARRLALSELLVDLDDPAAVAALRQRSPELHLARTARPLLLFAGGRDPKIDVVDVKHYAAALQELGKDVSLLIDDEQGHSFDREPGFEAYLVLVERYLEHHLGGRAGATVDPRIERYIEANLRMVGASLREALTQ